MRTPCLSAAFRQFQSAIARRRQMRPRTSPEPEARAACPQAADAAVRTPRPTRLSRFAATEQSRTEPGASAAPEGRDDFPAVPRKTRPGWNASLTVSRSRSVQRAVPLSVALLLMVAVGMVSARAQSEDGVKAAFLFNFAKFVEWPAAAFGSPQAPFVVGFVGKTALADTLEQNVKGKNANGREFAIKRLDGVAGVEGCHVVYVAEAAQAAPAIGAARGKPVLTVGEDGAFLGAGGAVAFGKDGAKVVFDLSREAAQAAGLKLDPKLEKVARSVK